MANGMAAFVGFVMHCVLNCVKAHTHTLHTELLLVCRKADARLHMSACLHQFDALVIVRWHANSLVLYVTLALCCPNLRHHR